MSKLKIHIYDDFRQFYEVAVNPLKTKNPEWIRLDGSSGTPDINPFAYFFYEGKKWRVDPDTHFDKLKIAYELFIRGEDTFVEEDTLKRKGKCLVILGQPKSKKMFYVYRVS